MVAYGLAADDGSRQFLGKFSLNTHSSLPVVPCDEGCELRSRPFIQRACDIGFILLNPLIIRPTLIASLMLSIAY